MTEALSVGFAASSPLSRYATALPKGEPRSESQESGEPPALRHEINQLKVFDFVI